jgi:hypothetical protein
MVTGFVNAYGSRLEVTTIFLGPTQFTIHSSTHFFSIRCSRAVWKRLEMADVPFTLGSWTVSVPQPQLFSTNSYTTTTFSTRLTPDSISLYHSWTLSLHNSSNSSARLKLLGTDSAENVPHFALIGPYIKLHSSFAYSGSYKATESLLSSDWWISYHCLAPGI